MESATSDLSRVLARQIAEGKLALPPLPATAAEVMSLCQLETTDAAKLSQVLHKDQTIATNVLRVANSVAYGGQAPCASLQQAVGRLGMQLITEIAMAVSVRGRMFTNTKCIEVLTALWKHSVLAAFFTKEIARMLRRNVEIAFLCGLLHDVGKAVLVNSVDDAAGRDPLAFPIKYLLRAVDEQHVAAGSLLAKRWQLPETIEEATRCHHDVTTAAKFGDMAMMVNFADDLSHWAAPSLLREAPTDADLRAHPMLVGLNLYPDQVEILLAMRDRALLVTEGMQ